MMPVSESSGAVGMTWSAPRSNAGHQLAQHAGLAQPLEQLRRELPGHEHDGQHDEEADDVAPVIPPLRQAPESAARRPRRPTG